MSIHLDGECNDLQTKQSELRQLCFFDIPDCNACCTQDTIEVQLLWRWPCSPVSFHASGIVLGLIFDQLVSCVLQFSVVGIT